jgi:glycyl-tRNA synthetase
VEMTPLQGIMGRVYAMNSGEPQAVADAIFEHYLPRGNDDVYPLGKPGLVVGLADRLDTLAGLFSVGLAPTGTRDPFAQRRAALGLVQNLMHWNLDLDLRWALARAGRSLPKPLPEKDLEACLEFIKGRLRGLLLDEGSRYDVVDAVLAVQAANPAGVKRSVEALSQWVAREDWNTILPAYGRCVRITRDLKQTFSVKPGEFVAPEEDLLYQALLKAEADVKDSKDVDVCLYAFLPMILVINTFFETVLVMAEEQAVRENRLGLLQRIAELVKPTADLAFLEGF